MPNACCAAIEREEALKKQLELLYEVQKIDTSIKNSEELKKKYNAEITKLEEEFSRAEETFSAEQSQLSALEKEQKEREKTLGAAREQKKKVEERIMSVKTNKEYQAGLLEVETIKGSIKQKEDAIIEIMDAIEEAKGALKKSSETLGSVKAQFDEKKRQIAVDLASYLQEIEGQKQQRELIVKDISADIFADYTRLLKVKNGRAVALAEHEQCTGCSMKIPPQIYNEVVVGNQLKTCPHCNRILYVEQTPAAEGEEGAQTTV